MRWQLWKLIWEFSSFGKMAKLPKEEKEAILMSLKALHSEEIQSAVALELRNQNNTKCKLPVLNEFNCTADCIGCIFRTELHPLRGVGGPEGFDEDQLTVRPKGWEPITAYNGRGTPQDSNIIRKHGWCHRCKEKLEECGCHTDAQLFKENNDV
jgi:hypothetical protein